ncbi:hypothetical protein TNCV_67361 [Trichonephila clavipes]|nr:hypothetical protein TNCV_67361 [Trichonephila clavipes]
MFFPLVLRFHADSKNTSARLRRTYAPVKSNEAVETCGYIKRGSQMCADSRNSLCLQLHTSPSPVLVGRNTGSDSCDFRIKALYSENDMAD